MGVGSDRGCWRGFPTHRWMWGQIVGVGWGSPHIDGCGSDHGCWRGFPAHRWVWGQIVGVGWGSAHIDGCGVGSWVLEGVLLGFNVQ